MLGLFAYANAKKDGSRDAFLGWSFLLVLAMAYALANELGIDIPTVLKGLPGSATTVVLIVLAAGALGAAAGLLARWSLRLNLSPVRVGLMIFGISFILINIWALTHRLQESS
jgi:membrane associated rhomboid family serine protease